MNPPLVSLVIPSYNSARFLAATLDSALAQQYGPLEIVLVDDGSVDNTADLASTYGGRLIYVRQENSGLAAARNTGMAAAKGELLAWLDADDLCHIDRILVQAAYLAHRPDVVAVATNFTHFEEKRGELLGMDASSYYGQIEKFGLERLFGCVETFNGNDVSWLSAPFEHAYRVHFGECWEKLILGNFMHPPTLMFRQSARERVGWLDSSLKSLTDWDYITRLAELGPVAFIDAPLLSYRRHSAQMSRVEATYDTQLLYISRMERILREHASRLAPMLPEVNSRFATYHETAAYVLAERSRLKALRHLYLATCLDYRVASVPKNLARIVAGAQGLQLFRRLCTCLGQIRTSDEGRANSNGKEKLRNSHP